MLSTRKLRDSIIISNNCCILVPHLQPSAVIRKRQVCAVRQSFVILVKIHVVACRSRESTKSEQFRKHSCSVLYEQWRTQVTWRPGQDTNLASPCSSVKSLGSKFTALKKVLATLLGFSPAVMGCPGNCAPPAPSSLHPCIRVSVDAMQFRNAFFIVLSAKCGSLAITQ